jgi:hypothetical protein
MTEGAQNAIKEWLPNYHFRLIYKATLYVAFLYFYRFFFFFCYFNFCLEMDFMRQAFIIFVTTKDQHLLSFAQNEIKSIHNLSSWLWPLQVAPGCFISSAPCWFFFFCFVLFVCLFVCLFCFVLFWFGLFCFVLFCFVLFCFVLFCFVLFCFVLFCLFCLFVCFTFAKLLTQQIYFWRLLSHRVAKPVLRLLQVSSRLFRFYHIEPARHPAHEIPPKTGQWKRRLHKFRIRRVVWEWMRRESFRERQSTQ